MLVIFGQKFCGKGFRDSPFLSVLALVLALLMFSFEISDTSTPAPPQSQEKPEDFVFSYVVFPDVHLTITEWHSLTSG